MARTVRRPKNTLSYVEAIAWIALNDEAGEIDVEFVATAIPVILLADLSNRTPEQVAEEVVKFRLMHQKQNPGPSEEETAAILERARQPLDWSGDEAMKAEQD